MNKGKNVKDPVQAAQPNEAGVAKGKKPNDEVSKALEPSNNEDLEENESLYNSTNSEISSNESEKSKDEEDDENEDESTVKVNDITNLFQEQFKELFALIYKQQEDIKLLSRKIDKGKEKTPKRSYFVKSPDSDYNEDELSL